MFRRKSKVELMCRQTGRWVVSDSDGNERYFLSSTSGGLNYEVVVRHHPRHPSTRFTTWLPVRFPLSNPPHGLFGRLMLRSWELVWSAWVLDIGDACEARACVTALLPNAGLDATLLDYICREQTEEVAAFHKELRDKFRYGGQFGDAASVPPQRTAAGVPKPWEAAPPPHRR